MKSNELRARLFFEEYWKQLNADLSWKEDFDDLDRLILTKHVEELDDKSFDLGR